MSGRGDFDGRPFIAGSLVGLRAFQIRRGQLAGAVFAVPFRPGENEAHCAGREHEWLRQQGLGDVELLGAVMTLSMQQSGLELSRALRGVSRQSRLASLLGKPSWTHAVAGLGCMCGFYAYTDGHNEYAPGGEHHLGRGQVVEALIEGYGVCTVGDRGFRASKARLVAVIDPPAGAWLEPYDVPAYPTREAALAAHPLTSVVTS